MSIVSHVVSRRFHGKTCTLETGGKLAGSCQVIKIALYECHDLLTQNGNRKIVAEWGEQIGIPWRTVGESFGAISHWTLLSLLFRPFICLKTRILWSCHGNISLFLFSLFSLYQATRRTKGPRTVIVLLKIRWMDFSFILFRFYRKFGNLRFASIREKAITELRETLFGIIETFLNTFYCLVSRKSNDLS